MSLNVSCTDDLDSHQLAWLRFLCGDSPKRLRWTHPALRRVLAEMAALCRLRLQAAIAQLINEPVIVRDDGRVRDVEIRDTVYFRMDRLLKTFEVFELAPSGTWGDLPSEKFSIDPFLCHRRWRARVASSLRSQLKQWFEAQLERAGLPLHSCSALGLIELTLEQAWNGCSIMKQLRRELPTKQVREQLRQAMDLDPALLNLARRSRLSTKKHHITQLWLTFVWQQRDTLIRIQHQTPRLLSASAEYLFRFGVVPGLDPVQALATWFRYQGVTRAGFRLLAQRSARPFRCVIRRWNDGAALDSLALALVHSATPNGATALRPAMYRALYDLFEPSARPTYIIDSYAPLPTVFFERARRAGAARESGAPLQEFLQFEFLPVADWLCSMRKNETVAGNVPAGDWKTWVKTAHAMEARRRVVQSEIHWHCAVSAWTFEEASFRALNAAIALFDEGRALRHCVDVYVDECLKGQVRLFSVWHKIGDQVHRATIGLKWADPIWVVLDVRGSCNRKLSGRWRRWAQALAEHYSTVVLEGSPPSPSAKSHKISSHETAPLNYVLTANKHRGVGK